jgi:phosphatidylglycerol---prolipoprotein diacylglyceryl transferase
LGGGLLIGWFLWWRLGKPHATGAILGQYLVLTGLARFLVEFIRRNPKVIWGLSNAQLASAGAVVAGLALVAWAAARHAGVAEKTAAPVVKTA